MTTEKALNESHSIDPGDPRVTPLELQIDRAKGLRIRWSDGVESSYPLNYLRRHCPCATCRSARQTPVSTALSPGISLPILPPGIERATQLSDASLVGRYAINIIWGDGHDTGIYDFRYLRQIAPTPANGE